MTGGSGSVRYLWLADLDLYPPPPPPPPPVLTLYCMNKACLLLSGLPVHEAQHSHAVRPRRWRHTRLAANENSWIAASAWEQLWPVTNKNSSSAQSFWTAGLSIIRIAGWPTIWKSFRRILTQLMTVHENSQLAAYQNSLLAVLKNSAWPSDRINIRSDLSHVQLILTKSELRFVFFFKFCSYFSALIWCCKMLCRAWAAGGRWWWWAWWNCSAHSPPSLWQNRTPPSCIAPVSTLLGLFLSGGHHRSIFVRIWDGLRSSCWSGSVITISDLDQKHIGTCFLKQTVVLKNRYRHHSLKWVFFLTTPYYRKFSTIGSILGFRRVRYVRKDSFLIPFLLTQFPHCVLYTVFSSDTPRTIPFPHTWRRFCKPLKSFVFPCTLTKYPVISDANKLYGYCSCTVNFFRLFPNTLKESRTIGYKISTSAHTVTDF